MKLSFFLLLNTVLVVGASNEVLAAKIKTTPVLSGGYTTDFFKDGSEEKSGEFLLPGISVDIELSKKKSSLGIFNSSFVNGRIVMDDSRLNSLSAGTKMDAVYLIGKAQEIGHSLGYSFSDESLDSANKIKSHSVFLINHWKKVSKTSSHTVEVPVEFKHFLDKTKGAGFSEIAQAQEADYRDSHILTGLAYQYKHFTFNKRNYVVLGSSTQFRHYFDRKARATDGGILPTAIENLEELRFKGALSYHADLKKVVFEPRFAGLYNLDAAYKAEDYWGFEPSLSATWRIHRKWKLSANGSYSVRKYINKFSDDFNLLGPKLATDTLSAGYHLQYKPKKSLIFFSNLDWEKFISSNVDTEYSAITTRVGLEVKI